MKHGSVLALATLALLGGCAGAQTLQATPLLSMPEKKTVKPKPLHVDPAVLTFGSASPQSFTAKESKYTGTWAIKSSNPKIAIVNPSTRNGPSGRFTVTPVSGGKCKITVRDSKGQHAAVTISVSSEIIIVSVTK